MPVDSDHATQNAAHGEPSIEEVETTPGRLVLEFGASWCPICRGARSLIDEALEARSDLSHRRVEDGKGKRLGRHYRVKLWPTLVFVQDGEERGRVVRPSTRHEVDAALLAAFC